VPDVDRFAAELLDALESHRLIELLSERDPALNDDSAYAIADVICQHRIARGETAVGRKIGFTNRNIWPEYNVWAPIWGHVYDSTLRHAPDARTAVSIVHLVQPRIEPEIVLHFFRTPPVTRDESAILECIDWIAHGFELVQCPFADWKFAAVDTIAAFGLHGALVVGPQVPVADIDDCVAKLSSFTIALSKDGKLQATGGGANVLDSPLLAFAHLSEVLAAQSRFPPVQAGELITTGTLTPAFPVATGQTWTTELTGIELPGLTIELTN
jgi:2-oxo-3-hexenedioate decarboxylase